MNPNGLMGVERRINLRLLAYWEKLRAGRPMPAPEDVKPDELHDLWDCCFMVHVGEQGTIHPTYTYLGQLIVDAHEKGVIKGNTGAMVSASSNTAAPPFSKVLENNKPFVAEGEFPNHNNELIKYRQCLLPLGRGERVEAIFGGVNFKAFPPNNSK